MWEIANSEPFMGDLGWDPCPGGRDYVYISRRYFKNGTQAWFIYVASTRPRKICSGGHPCSLCLVGTYFRTAPKRDVILSWLSEGVNVLEFTVHFSGFFKGVQYDSSQPPSKIWPNHASCKKFHNLCTCRISPSFDMCSTLVFRP